MMRHCLLCREILIHKKQVCIITVLENLLHALAYHEIHGNMSH